ncbi:MAG: hypothetical protein DRM99_00480 [Thermoplasmata archaeon]|nr:MAG: hypothetical protein DRM99_00480 [Thermoplasmata archaeon]
MKKLTILHYYHIYNKPITGGVEAYIYNVCNSLKNKVNFIVISNKHSGEKNREKFSETEVFRVEPEYKNIGKIKRFLDIFLNESKREKNKRKLIDSINYDVLHIHGPTAFSNFSIFGALFWVFQKKLSFYNIKNRNIIFTFHGLPEVVMKYKYKWGGMLILLDFLWKKIIKSNLNIAKKVICVDKYIIDQLSTYGIDKNKIIFIPNGVDLKIVKPINRKTAIKRINKKYRLNLRADVKIFSYIARLSKEKGVQDILRLAKFMKDKNAKFRFIIAGEGKYRKTVINLCRKDSRFSYIGNIPYEDVSYLINCSDYIVNPLKHPAISRTNLEAIACQIPVITTKVLNRYPVVHGKTGILYNSQQEFNKIFHNIVRRKLIFKFHKIYFKKMIKEFDMNNINKKVLAVYKQAKSI